MPKSSKLWCRWSSPTTRDRRLQADAGATDPDQLYEALETARLYRLAVGRPLPPRPHYRIPGLTEAGVRAAVVLANGDPDDAYLIALDVRSTSHSPARTAAERVRVQAYEQSQIKNRSDDAFLVAMHTRIRAAIQLEFNLVDGWVAIAEWLQEGVHCVRCPSSRLGRVLAMLRSLQVASARTTRTARTASPTAMSCGQRVTSRRASSGCMP
jgi:hypothetical protein